MLHKCGKKIAGWLRHLANLLDPPVPTKADALYPLALKLVKEVESIAKAGSIRHLIVMKQMERETGASRLDINEAIERAVRASKHGN